MRRAKAARGEAGVSVLDWIVIVALVVVATGLLVIYARHLAPRPPAQAPPSGTTPPAGTAVGGTVTVLGVWGGSELESFRAMVKPFEAQTGVKVDFEGTRDINAVLTTRVKGGNPPDVAGLPNPGQMSEFVRARNLTPLDGVLDLAAMKQQYAQSWVDLATVDGKIYGISIKAAVKGLIWYNPKAFQAAGYAVPKTWDEMITLTGRIAREGKVPWCIGLESGAASGWPATDWIENILLRASGPETYTKWVRHEIPWTDPAVRQAWELFGLIATKPAYVRGGIQGELATNFGESPFPLFSNPPGCYLHHQASFIQDFIQKQFPNLKPVEDVNFFVFPPINAAVPASVEVAGDVFGMFRDTPQARALIRYLTTPDAQVIWVKRGGALSPNRKIGLDQYPDPLSRRAAEILTGAQIVRFDASDLMPEPLSSAFLRAALEYVQHPDGLNAILGDLERVAAEPARK